jgi:hypothetical protein
MNESMSLSSKGGGSSAKSAVVKFVFSSFSSFSSLAIEGDEGDEGDRESGTGLFGSHHSHPRPKPAFSVLAPIFLRARLSVWSAMRSFAASL